MSEIHQMNEWRKGFDELESLPGVKMPDKAQIWENVRQRLERAKERDRQRRNRAWLAAASLCILFTLLWSVTNTKKQTEYGPALSVIKPSPVNTVAATKTVGDADKQDQASTTNNIKQSAIASHKSIIIAQAKDTTVWIVQSPTVINKEPVPEPASETANLLQPDIQVVTSSGLSESGSMSSQLSRITKKKPPEGKTVSGDDPDANGYILINTNN